MPSRPKPPATDRTSRWESLFAPLPADLMREFARSSVRPLDADLVGLLDNLPAVGRDTLPYSTRASRTFVLPSGHGRRRQAPVVRASEFVEGGWEIDAEATFSRLPGREEIVLAQASPSSARRPTEALDGHIPDTRSLMVHPQLASLNQRRSVTTDSKGRRYQNSEEPHSQIYNGESRSFIRPSGFPECCVCKLYISTQAARGGPWSKPSEATGFLAGRNVCISSGHARPKKPYFAWSVQVIPGLYGSQSVFGPNFFTYAHSYVAYDSDAGNDMMALGLYDPLGDRAGYFGATAYNDDWEDMNVWSMCGYPYDRSLVVPSYEGGIAIYDDDDGDDVTLPNGQDVDSTQLESYADEASGASGAPLYSWFTDGHLRAVGVHKGRELIDYAVGEDRNSVASGGDLLPALIRWARDAWP